MNSKWFLRFGYGMTIGIVLWIGLLGNFSIALSQSRDLEVNLVSFAAPTASLQEIVPKFTAKWKREMGQSVKFNTSYGGSGAQTRAIIDGLEADIAFLAIPIDMERLEKAGLVGQNWQSRIPNQGIVTRSVIALATRPGNPKNIRDWSDLSRSGVRIVTANPKTSGVARWNFLGLWGSVIGKGGSEAQAKDYVTAVYRNVPILPRDAREATDIFFKRNQGDVLLNYENELILADQQGQRSTFIIPSPNLSIDNPIAVVDKNVDKRGTRKVAEAFVKYLFSAEAQREFAAKGFRPIVPTVAKEFAKNFRKVDKLLTIKDLGGWETVQRKFFGDQGIFDQVQAAIGR